MAGEAWQQGIEVAGHIASSVTVQREVNAGGSSIFVQFRLPAHRMGPLTF